MERIGGERQGQTSSIRQVVLASFIGTTIEWYDFFLYGTAAALVFNKLFFPEFSPLAGTLAAFSTYAVGFMARPLGGVVFGHFGDKIGRKSMLVLSLLIMGIATFAIGLLPTFETIGVWAPILLVLMRIFQGFGVGGEWGGAVLMAVEHAPRGRRGFYGAWPQMGVPAGLLLANLIYFVTLNALGDQFLVWGWRLPFLLSIVLVAVGLFIRLRIAETPAFEQVKESRTESRMPIIEAVRDNPRNMLLGMGSRVANNAGFYILTVFLLSYVTTQVGVEQNVGLLGVIIASTIGLFTIPFYGALSDRIGRRPVFLGGIVFMGLFAFPFFWLLDTGSTVLIVLAVVIGLNIGHDAQYGPQAIFLSELFDTRVRYSGASLGYQLATILAGGFAPLICTALVAWSGGEPWPVSLYWIGLVLISFVSVYLASETYQSDLAEPEARAERPGV